VHVDADAHSWAHHWVTKHRATLKPAPGKGLPGSGSKDLVEQCASAFVLVPSSFFFFSSLAGASSLTRIWPGALAQHLPPLSSSPAGKPRRLPPVPSPQNRRTETSATCVQLHERAFSQWPCNRRGPVCPAPSVLRGREAPEPPLKDLPPSWPRTTKLKKKKKKNKKTIIAHTPTSCSAVSAHGAPARSPFNLIYP